MAHTYEELKGMTVAQLREIAQGIEHEALQGFSTMHKEQLLPALCKALNIDARVHHVAVGIDKTKIKQEIRQFKAKRKEAIAAKDTAQLAQIRHELRTRQRNLRRAIV